MVVYFVFVFVFVLWQCSTPDGSGKLERALRAAGNNRPELEKVLAHYAAQPEDSLKWRAACFLIENMPGHYTVESDVLQAFRKRADRDAAPYFSRKAFVKIFILFLAAMGGCSGSTAGGIKIFRMQILMSVLKHYLKRLTSSFEVFPLRYQNKKIEDKSILAIVSFLLLLAMSFFFSVILISIVSGISVDLAIPMVISCLFNLGYNLDYGNLSELSKIILSIDMLLGRLEIVPLVVLFSKSFWKV